jgi:hypothetical protein
MIKRLYELGYFDYRKFIVDNQKKLSLSPLMSMVLIRALDIYKTKKTTATQEEFCDNLLISLDEADEVLSKLFEQGFYQIFTSENDNHLVEEFISFDGFFDKVEAVIKNDLLDEGKDDLSKTIFYLQNEMHRVLTSKEIDIVTSLVIDDKYQYDQFTKAVNYLVDHKRNITIKSICDNLSQDTKVHKKKDNKLMKDFMDKIK